MTHLAIDDATRGWLGVLVPSGSTVAEPALPGMPVITLFDTKVAMRDTA